ncbi:hypothetical protein NX059_011526 [Plenodomus lindquistii]|nr:hypothetical protein NX059_011526 [Plenodomus lindquistii]
MPAVLLPPVCPSTWTSSSHPKVDGVSAQVDDWFLRNWPFADEKAKKKFVTAGFSHVTCLYFPLARDERIASACKLLTILFLIDDILEDMSFDEGSKYNEHLMPIAKGVVAPDYSIPVEWMFHEIWDEMREIDRGLADSILEPVFVFMRAQTDKSRTTIDQLGTYLVYREKDVGSALLSALMRFTMDLRLDPADLSALCCIEQNHAKHITIVNDIYSWEKELRQAKNSAQEGSALCSAVKIMADNTGLDIESSKKVLWSMVREWEIRHEILSEALCDTKNHHDKRALYAEGLKYQMSGNETWKGAKVEMADHTHSHSLGALDDIMPDINLPFVFAFPCHKLSQPKTTARLARSFETLLSTNPWLSCTIEENVTTTHHRPGTRSLSNPLEASSKGLRRPAGIQALDHPQLVIQDLCQHPLYVNKNYDDLIAERMPPKFLDSNLIMPDRETGKSGTKFILQARVSFINDGVLLCLCTSHTVMDATGLSKIAEAWAALARGDPAEELRHYPLSEEDMGLEGDTCSEAEVYDRLKNRKELWHMLGLDYRPKELTSAMLARKIPQRETDTRIFRLRAEQLRLLREQCITTTCLSTPESTRGWVSTNDAISSLLWRCIVRARSRTVEEMCKTSTMMYAMNIRGALSRVQTGTDKRVGRDQIANAVVYSVNKARTRDLVAARSIGEIAKDIRAAVNSHREPTVLRDVFKLATSIPDVSQLGLVYPTWLAEDVVISSLSGLALYKTHWGSVFGGSYTVPDYVRFPQGIFEGITFVMPQRRNGEMEVVVTMITEDMEALLQDQEWQNHMEVIS